MPELPRKIHRQKIFTGVILLCTGAILMLMGQDIASPFYKTVWMALLAMGVFFYLWGRFFSREEA